jgi:CRP-like cAMP-binding protein
MPRGKVSEVALTLDSVELFSGCSQKELRTVASLCTRLDIEAGFVLTRQGTRDPECFVVGAGSAAVEIDGRAVGTVGPGDVVGEMSLLDGGPRSATVTALSPMTLYVMSRREFQSMMRANPSIVGKIATSLARRLRQAQSTRPH